MRNYIDKLSKNNLLTNKIYFARNEKIKNTLIIGYSLPTNNGKYFFLFKLQLINQDKLSRIVLKQFLISFIKSSGCSKAAK